MEKLPENYDGHFPNHWTKDKWCDKLNIYEWLTINGRGVRLAFFTCKSVGKPG
jgi:hypothetical protein